MSPLRVYKCLVCARGEERLEAWEQAPPLRCPYCRALAYQRVLFAPQVVVAGSKYVNGERRLVRERVVQNRDGSETVYGSVAAAERGERERAAAVAPSPAAAAMLARKNAQALVSGMVPGRASTAFREACEEPRR